jgi:hypothetical protein
VLKAIITLMTEAVNAFETPVNFYKNTLRNIFEQPSPETDVSRRDQIFKTRHASKIKGNADDNMSSLSNPNPIVYREHLL